MKTYLFLILLLSNTLQSQTTWFSQTSGTPTKLNSIYFVNNLTGYCVGDSGRILKTTNGGNNWISKSIGFIIGFPININSVFFTNENTGIAVGGAVGCGNCGTSLKTTNGGMNWIDDVGVFPQNTMKSVFFVTANSGYAVGGNNIYKSINNGNSWSLQYSFDNANFNSVFFINSNTGYAVGGQGKILKTSNGGINWNDQNSNGTYLLHSVQFLNDNTGYIASSGGKILKTVNGGSNWTTISVLGISDEFYSSYFTSSVTGFAVGQGSTIVKTINSGIDWEAELSPSIQTLNSVFFPDANTGYAVGNGGTIIKTTNGGTAFTGININLKILMEGLYYPLFNLLSRRDTMKVTLRETTSPYLKKDSSFCIIDSNTYLGLFNFLNAPSGIYYIVVKHFNSIETWSKSGGETLVSNGSVYSYDFTTEISKAYGDNLKFKGGKYCLYGGNVNGDAIVDASDLSDVDNDAYSGRTGRYLRADVNGDSFVDASDITIVDNNRSAIIISP